MKKILKFLTVSLMLITLCSCGTDQIFVPDDDDSQSGSVIYVSPADATAAVEAGQT